MNNWHDQKYSPVGDNRTLYNIHCKTWALARRIRGETRMITRVDMSEPMPNDGVFRFRCIPKYRSPDALNLRKQVADIIREDRQHGGKL